ncbi:heterochromatin-associated protein MENT-like [Amphibalanus amphitrite]|uniref:heterochromatin-associated protein MENT-like n=1 Tax=Amphibalanus amphitrite TaxID=1232801 RepID=UPI001C929503|nr:heterochromatin-associated protein MENT-like [Amphibalanus amphitrite]
MIMRSHMKGPAWALIFFAVTTGAAPPEKSKYDLWSTNHASDTFSYDLPWNDWEVTTATFRNSNGTNSSAGSRPGPVPSGMDLKVLKELTADLRRNQAISPFVISVTMSQVWLAADGITRNEITPTLGLTTPNPKDFLLRYHAAISYLSPLSSGSVTAAAYSRLYVSERISVLPAFSSVLSRYYLTKERPFSSPAQAVSEINRDVTNMTGGRISSVVSKEEIQGASFFTVGAFYFRAPWKTAFTPSQKMSFLTAAGEKQVKAMTLNNIILPYIKEATFDAISLPYSDGNFSMLLLRPIQRTMDAVTALRVRLDTLNVTDVMVQLESKASKNILVKMPTFTIEGKNSLNPAMHALRISKIFAPGANFKGITDQQGLYLNDIFHTVYINVSETGEDSAKDTTAPAQPPRRSLPGPLYFELDRPFFVIIYNRFCRTNFLSAFIASP